MGIGDPGYISNPPPPLEIPNDGTVSVSPDPNFTPGASRSITVTDGNATDIKVKVENLTTGEVEESSNISGGSFDMIETGTGRGIYVGILATSNSIAIADNDGTLFVAHGHIVRVTYSDDDPPGDISVETTANDAGFYVVPLPGGGAAVFVL